MKQLPFLLAICAFAGGCKYSTDTADNSTATSLRNSNVESAATRAHYETITRVVDGDTYVIGANWSPYELEWRIRLLGVDTPEKGHLAKCDRERDLSAQAQALSTKLLNQSKNRVRLQDVKHDKYGGRLDATVLLSDGTTLEEHLIQEGLARRYTGDGPKPNWCRP